MKWLNYSLLRVVSVMESYPGGGYENGGMVDGGMDGMGGFNTAMLIEILKVAAIAFGIVFGSWLVGVIIGKVVARIAYPAQESVYSLPEKIIFYTLMLASVTAIIGSVVYFLWPL